MPELTLKALMLASAAVLFACASDRHGEERVWEDETGRVTLVELSPESQSALRLAPTANLVGMVPRETRKAINFNSITGIKIELFEDKLHGKVIKEDPPTYQGWIYYELTRLADGSLLSVSLRILGVLPPREVPFRTGNRGQSSRC